MGLLVAVAALIELVLCAVVVSTALRERSALARLVRASPDPERLKDVAMQLPGAYRAPATAFAGELARKAPLDEALAQALSRAVNTRYGLAPVLRIAGGLGISLAVLTPLVAGLMAGARGLDEARRAAQGLAGSRGFLEARAHLTPAFEGLREAFEASAVLMVGLALITALHWWLNGSTVREARFVRALLEAAAGARPNATAPVSVRLAQLLAPPRSLGAPALALGLFFAALLGGWVLLYLTASVRAGNASVLFDVWPQEARGLLKAPAGMVVPSFVGGGAPLEERSLATLSVGPHRVEAAGDVLAELDARYALPEKFPEGANDVAKTIAGFKRQGSLDVNLLGHASVPMRTVRSVLDHLTTLGLRRAHCVIERAMGGTTREARVPAGLWLELGGASAVPALTLGLQSQRVVVDPGKSDALTVETNDPAWGQRLGQIVRTRTAARAADPAATVVAVQLANLDLSYDRFLEVLASADSACTTRADCGVPGLGLRFVLDR